VSACLITVTVADAAEAERIGRTLVAERLAAAANVLPGVRSFYWWDGSLQTAAEALLILKTRRDLAPSAVERIKALHSYVCPGAMIVSIDGGNQAYLDWIAAETQPKNAQVPR
jgi:periplasmic divalent cation tolerance protein